MREKIISRLKSLTIAKLFRLGLKSAIFLWAAFLIVFAPKIIYDVAQSYGERWYNFGKGDFLDPKKYIWFVVPLRLFNIFFSCYVISDIWHRKNILYLLMMLVIIFMVNDRVLALDHYMRYATIFWR